MKNKNITTIEVGKKYYDSLGHVTVLCFVEKHHLVAKRPRCSPFVCTLNEFTKRFKNE